MRANLGRIVVLAVGVSALAAGGAQAGGYKPTHKVTASGRFVDHWTVNSPDDCGPVGSGTVTVTFKMIKAKGAEVTIDPEHNAEPNNTLGSWVLLGIGDSFGHLTDIPAQPAKATITRVDNTTPRPPANPEQAPCEPADKSGCGTRSLGKPDVKVGGYNRKHIYGDLYVGEFGFARCQIGSVDGFDSPPSQVGGTADGRIVIKMPSLSKFQHRNVTVVKRTVHKHSATGDPGSDQYTDDVTRSMKVTFTRIHR